MGNKFDITSEIRQLTIGARHPPILPANCPADWLQENTWRGWEAPANVVRGEAVRQSALQYHAGLNDGGKKLVPVTARLRREPSNAIDPNAVTIHIEKAMVGYLAREIAATIAPLLDAARHEEFSLAGVIRGGSRAAPALNLFLWPQRRITPGPEIRIDLRDKNYWTPWPPEEGEGE